jgi:hypothetical protein
VSCCRKGYVILMALATADFGWSIILSIERPIILLYITASDIFLSQFLQWKRSTLSDLLDLLLFWSNVDSVYGTLETKICAHLHHRVFPLIIQSPKQQLKNSSTLKVKAQHPSDLGNTLLMDVTFRQIQFGFSAQYPLNGFSWNFYTLVDS